MSRLKELRLHGFKTFADPTRFVFERGVTAVIGPNGSGKSNMADAVRWVLGEQSNRSLRTRRADDVIFAGSQGRRPLGMAEAVLTLDNADHWLPIEFAEVSIGRRAYRSGETEYLINGARARLKDVVDLLAGGRLGANELVVVGQGTVDAALSLRPEERRQLFEEAAGVKNLQVRKNEALGRLARARDNLTRVDDLVSELKPQVRRLSLQAQHQQEHDALGYRARALVLEAHRRREVSARGSLGEARRRLAAAEASLDALRADERAGSDALAEAERRYWAAEAAARAAAERREASREASIRAEAAAASAARRHEDRSAAIARAEAELASIAAAPEEPEADDADAERASRAAAEAERAWREAIARLEAAEREIDEADRTLSAARREAGAWIAEAVRDEESAARAGAKVEHLESELAAASAAAREAERAAITAQGELAAAGAGEAAALDHLAAARELADGAERTADAERARATALAERVGGLRAEMDALRERSELGGRLASSLEAAGWQGLLDAIPIPEPAWAAVEAVVGGDLRHALLWREGDPGSHASDARGTARLLVGASTNDIARERAERGAALVAVGATETLAEWIDVSDAPLVLARAVVAPDLAALLHGWRAMPAGWCAVTRDGDLADARGVVAVRGRREAQAGEGARQHTRLRELTATIDALDAEQHAAGEGAAQALVAATAARGDRDEALRIHGEAERRMARARDADGRATAARAQADDHEVTLRSQLDEARRLAVARDASRSTSPIASEIDRLAATAAEAHRRHQALAEERDARRAAWQAARTVADAIDTRLGARHGARAARAARRDQLQSTLATERTALLVAVGEMDAATAAVSAAATADEAATQERGEADAERDRLRAELLEGERARGGAASQAAALEREVQACALDAQRLDDELIAIGRERDLAIESLPPATGEGAPGAPGAADAAADGDLASMAADAIDVDLAKVRRTLAQIGSVNPFAVEEHREVAGRLEALTSQESDLSAAISSTEQLIGKLEAEIAAQFNAAFVAIGEKFDEFCRLLFAGGSASLQMSDGDEGDGGTGIEIAVRPPGKRLQRLAMLSGGERALAGVALLFAMLSVNPVPFCILDEVDAALDEANIGRFADALRLLAQQIDFVVITHNRATIETADTIYGVTMTDAAVSRLLSLRLADLPVEVAAG